MMTNSPLSAAQRVQARRVPLHGGGSVSWEEHCEAFKSPEIRDVTRNITGSGDHSFTQDFPHVPETVAQAGGFSRAELERLIGHPLRSYENDE